MDTLLQQAILFGYPVHLVTCSQAAQYFQEVIQAKQNVHIVTLNPEMLMQGEQDPALGSILKNASLVLPDGAGLVWALKTRGYRSVQRVPGIEFSEEALAIAAEKGYRVALIGARPDVLDRAIANLQERYPGLQVVYAHHGFFESAEQEAAVAQACAETSPQLLLVALGVPKQEKWIAEFKPLFTQTVFIGVGGSLDVWSGVTRRAPWFFRTFNLEWLYRITSEPWRIRRISKTLPLFVVKVIMASITSPSLKPRTPTQNHEVS